MEKFIGSLEDTGFEASMALVGTLTKTQVSNISGALKEIEDANKRINKTSLNEVGVRQKAIRLIKEQRAAISESLTGGTVGQAQAGLEGLNMDPEAINFGKNALDIQQRLFELQREKIALNASDHEGILRVNNAIERQQRLYTAMTEQRNSLNEAFSSSLKSNLSDVLKGAKTLSEGIHGILDVMSNTIIDTVVGSFTDALIESAGLKEMFGGLFDTLFGSGNGIGEKIGANVKDSISGSLEGVQDTGGFNKFFGSLSSGFSSLIGGLGNGLSSILSGIGGMFGGGGFGSLLSTGLSFLGFSQGGVVPNTPFSQVGKDSVPAMLMPGEVVMSKNAVRNMDTNKSQTTQSFNINVQGDVSRQTRQEIIKMIPQITGGVNAQNKESNYRR